MSKRDAIIDWAKSQIGPGDRAEYWRIALGYDPGKNKHWCGAFCLAALHSVGLALDHKWGIDGTGMVGPLKLKPTRTPSRGDILYVPHPYQHHALFDYEHDGWVYSIDGNQPDVREKRRRRDGLVFYSIQPLVDAWEQAHDTDMLPPPTALAGAIRPVDGFNTPEPGFLRGQKYSVPGVQDTPGGPAPKEET